MMAFIAANHCVHINKKTCIVHFKAFFVLDVYLDLFYILQFLRRERVVEDLGHISRNFFFICMKVTN